MQGSEPASRVPAFDRIRSSLSTGLEGLSVGRNAKRKERLIMALYEHVYMARQDVTAQQVEALTEQLKGVLAAHGGSVSKVEYWGVKSLAFRVKKNRKAHFSLLNIDAPSAAVVEMERQLGLNEDVIRYLTLRVDEHEEGQSAMLRKRDDADRDDRGERRGARFDRGDRPDRGDRSDRPRRPRDDAAPGGAF
jgi:small subunit ribosomal protein S6